MRAITKSAPIIGVPESAAQQPTQALLTHTDIKINDQCLVPSDSIYLITDKSYFLLFLLTFD
jgi:hypothetical protein